MENKTKCFKSEIFLHVRNISIETLLEEMKPSVLGKKDFIIEFQQFWKQKLEKLDYHDSYATNEID